MTAEGARLRLMTIETVARGLVEPGNVVKRLREHPERVDTVQLFQPTDLE